MPVQPIGFVTSALRPDDSNYTSMLTFYRVKVQQLDGTRLAYSIHQHTGRGVDYSSKPELIV